MNRNIEVINENLWAVNQYYVKQGFIQELKILPNKTPELYDISLTNQGILVLNKAAYSYEVTKLLVIRIMRHTDEQLRVAQEKIQRVENPDAYEKMYLNVLEWEIKRRCVKAAYIKSLPKPTFRDKLKNYIRKKVKG